MASSAIIHLAVARIDFCFSGNNNSGNNGMPSVAQKNGCLCTSLSYIALSHSFSLTLWLLESSLLNIQNLKWLVEDMPYLHASNSFSSNQIELNRCLKQIVVYLLIAILQQN